MAKKPAALANPATTTARTRSFGISSSIVVPFSVILLINAVRGEIVCKKAICKFAIARLYSSTILAASIAPCA